MQGESYVGLFCRRNDSLKVVGNVVPHLIQRVGCLAGERRKVFDAVVVEVHQAGSAAAGDDLVALDYAVGVKVVLHHRQTLSAGDLDCADDGFDIFVATGFTEANSIGQFEHDVPQFQPRLSGTVDVSFQGGVGPGFDPACAKP